MLLLAGWPAGCGVADLDNWNFAHQEYYNAKKLMLGWYRRCTTSNRP